MINNLILLIPHYNDPTGLSRSLSSIEKSENLDVIIVDDGSQINCFDENEVRESFKANGTIYFKYLVNNKGIEFALNAGLDFILQNNQYKYIARLDCADKCIGPRFRIQQNFLENNPEVKLVSSHMECVDTAGRFITYRKFPLTHEEIEKKMYLNNMFSHVAAMFTSDSVRAIGKYPTNYRAAEDYAFFFKFIKNFKTANLDQFLVRCELNPAGISYVRRNQQVRSRIRIELDNFDFGFWSIYGIVRNCIIYCIPFSLLQKIKSWV